MLWLIGSVYWSTILVESEIQPDGLKRSFINPLRLHAAGMSYLTGLGLSLCCSILALHGSHEHRALAGHMC